MKIKAMCVLGLALYAMGAPVQGWCNSRGCNKNMMDRFYATKSGECQKGKGCQSRDGVTSQQVITWAQSTYNDKGNSKKVKQVKASCKNLNELKEPSFTVEEWIQIKDNILDEKTKIVMDSTYGVCADFKAFGRCKEPSKDQLLVWTKFGHKAHVKAAKERCKHMPA